MQDFVKAVTILIAAHYVFNLAYSKKLRSTYCFIQKYLLQIQDNSNCPTKVLNLMSKLKKSSLIWTWNNVLYFSFRANFLLKQFFVKRKTVDSKLLVFYRRVFEKVFTVEVQDFVKVVAILIAAHYSHSLLKKSHFFIQEYLYEKIWN